MRPAAETFGRVCSHYRRVQSGHVTTYVQLTALCTDSNRFTYCPEIWLLKELKKVPKIS